MLIHINRRRFLQKVTTSDFRLLQLNYLLFLYSSSSSIFQEKHLLRFYFIPVIKFELQTVTLFFIDATAEQEIFSRHSFL